jgi:hypothetical protein
VNNKKKASLFVGLALGASHVSGAQNGGSRDPSVNQ